MLIPQSLESNLPSRKSNERRIVITASTPCKLRDMPSDASQAGLPKRLRAREEINAVGRGQRLIASTDMCGDAHARTWHLVSCALFNMLRANDAYEMTERDLATSCRTIV